jgi:endonuclease/exonuclease/phosphatase (EEP) superfamily protein YafD
MVELLSPQIKTEHQSKFSFRTALTGILRGLVVLYGLVTIGFLVVRLIVGERWQIISIFNTGLYLALFLALILLPLMLLMRQWRLAWLVAPAFIVLIVHYAPFYLPRPVTVPPDARRLRLLTYNLHAETQILAPMIAVVRDADADVVALQEVSEKAASQFDTALGDMYPYRAFYTQPGEGRYYGRGFLSRYPFREHKEWPVEFPIPLRLQRLVIDLENTSVVIYNFHAPPSRPIFGEGLDFAPRAQQISDLVALAGEESGAVVLMGDFNITDWDENYARIVTNFHDVYREVGWGIGFTNPDWSFDQAREGLPFVPMHQRPDSIFYNDRFLPVEARVWSTSGGSDHRPIFAILTLLKSS